MKKENAKQNILPRMLVLALVFLFVGFPPGVVGYAREVLPQATLSAALPAVQIFATSGGDPYQTNQQVGYALTGDTAETPMPAGSAGNRYDFTMAGNSTGSIVIDYPAEGTFQYTINEEIPSGFAYEWTPTRYRITVYAYGSTPIVIMKNDAGEKVPELHWTYVYQLPAPSPSPSAVPSPSPSAAPSPSVSPSPPSASPSSSASLAPSASPTPSSDSSGEGADGGPKTGDESQMGLWIILAAAGAGILVFGYRSARRHE